MTRESALVLAGIAVGLAAAEVGLRLAARTPTPLGWTLREWDPALALLEPLGAHCYRGRPGSVLRYPNGAVAVVNRQGFRGPEVAVPKPADTYRVVLVGGSTVHGFRLAAEETLDAHLRAALAAAAPGARIEVVNLGFDGLDAHCDLERLRSEGLRLAPDAIVAHTGVNDAEAVRGPALALDDPARGFRAARRRAEDARARQPRWWRRLKHHVFLARLPGVLRHLGRQDDAPLPGLQDPVPAALDAFAATAAALVDVAPPETFVVLSTPPSAPRGPLEPVFACGRRIVDAATTLRYRAALAARLAHVAATRAAAGRRVAYLAAALPPDAFLDDCHPTGDGNRRLAAALAGVLAPDVLSRVRKAGMTDRE